MEALGGAASVIGVASLAIEVCKGLNKIHDFWQSVKEAPDHIARISTETNLLITWLTVIGNNYQRQGFDDRNPNHVAATDTLKLCLAMVQDMNDEVDDLEGRLSTSLMSRRWASVKFVFRKEKRETLMDQIERMKSLLIIVQTCYIGDIQDTGFRSLSMRLRPRDLTPQDRGNAQFLDTSAPDSLESLSVAKAQEIQPIPNSPIKMISSDPSFASPALRQPRHSTIRQEKRAFNFGFAVVKFMTTEQNSILYEESGNNRGLLARRNQYDLRMAQWLSSRGFSWQSLGISSSWQYNLRTFRYIPENALIVDFCVDGDVTNVQRMFDKGLASPFDRVRFEDQDWSLLHFSIANCNVKLCKFLIECGLGRGSASGMSRDPILSLVGKRSGVSSLAAHIDILRLMVHEGQYDPMEQSNNLFRTTVMHKFGGSASVFEWLLDQEEFMIDFEQRTTLGRETIAASLINSQHLNSSSCLEAVIARGSDLTDPGDIVLLEDDWWLLYKSIFSLARGYMADVIDFPKRVRVLWDAGADFHAPKVHHRFGTTLDFLFHARLLGYGVEDRKHTVEQNPIPALPLMSARGVIEYDRLENISQIKDRPRKPKSLCHEWFPGNELPMLEVAQRYLDAWTEILLEAGLDIAEYGRREDQMHPEGLFDNECGQARCKFEYGDHVKGCRIHVVEIWRFGSDWDAATSAASAKMPGSWDFDDA